MDFTKDLGDAIRKARKQANLTQVEFADLVDMSDKTLRDIERGRSGPSFEHVVRAAQAVGIRLRFDA